MSHLTLVILNIQYKPYSRKLSVKKNHLRNRWRSLYTDTKYDVVMLIKYCSWYELLSVILRAFSCQFPRSWPGFEDIRNLPPKVTRVLAMLDLSRLVAALSFPLKLGDGSYNTHTHSCRQRVIAAQLLIAGYSASARGVADAAKDLVVHRTEYG